MFGALFGWSLHRSPLAAAVPLEGSDTVQGLRTLERLRSANLLGHGNAATGRGAPAMRRSRRHNYQRFKGPFLEQMSTDDLRKDPKSWKLFAGDADHGLSASGFNLPASLDLMFERIEENLAHYLPNYVRLAVAVVLLTFYLRPKALLGGCALAYAMHKNIGRIMEQHHQAAQQQQQQQAAGGGGGVPPPLPNRPPDPNDQLSSLVLAVGTWVVVAYTRCMPILVLGIAFAVAAVLLHAAMRRAPLEYRHRGRAPLGFTLAQMLGRQPVPVGCDRWLLFRQMGRSGGAAVASHARNLGRWTKYHALVTWDAVKRPFARRARAPTLPWGW